MKIVVLDRDGVINEDSEAYIKSAEEWRPIAGSLDAIGRLCQAGFHVYVASNQSAVGRGLIDLATLFAIHDRLQRDVAELGGRIDAIEFAPEHPDRATALRKPNPGMLTDLARRLQVSLEGVPYVGDSLGDLQAARAAGARPILVRTGNGRRTETEHGPEDALVFDDLAGFASYWIERDQRPQTA